MVKAKATVLGSSGMHEKGIIEVLLMSDYVYVAKLLTSVKG
jgi:hypothetical protein